MTSTHEAIAAERDGARRELRMSQVVSEMRLLLAARRSARFAQRVEVEQEEAQELAA